MKMNRPTGIRELKPERYNEWNEYIYNHLYGSAFHLTQWKVSIEKAFGHKTFYYFYEKGGVILGVLPMVQLKSMFFGNIISSLPFAAYGGPLADNTDIFDKLLCFAKNLTTELKGDYLDLKFLQQVDNGLSQSDLYVTFIKSLSSDNDENMKAIPRKQRAMVRKGMKAGLTAHNSKDTLDDFYDIYAKNVQRLGTPVYSKKWFKTLLDVYGDNAEMLIIRHRDKTISGVLSLYYKDVILPYYAASLSEYRHLAPNDFQYWTLMKHAVEKGCRYFDFGRSKRETGSYKFKINWGFEPQQLHYQYYLNKIDIMPELNPLNPRYRLKIEVWKRLPEWVAKTIGPHIVKSIP